jgi:DNA-directed RNA polymerase subunit RPC12/RpoP
MRRELREDGEKIRDDKEEMVPIQKVIQMKKCVDCGQEYQPTSNVQKRCPECRNKKNKEEKRSIPRVKKEPQVIRNASKDGIMPSLCEIANLVDTLITTYTANKKLDIPKIMDARAELLGLIGRE